jgi:MFS family permease
MHRFISLILLLTFFASGCAALMYQTVWQRYLFTGLGVDIDSVTLIVSAFMLGIGVGGGIGGWMADRWPDRRLLMYAAAELLLATIGLVSPWLFERLPGLAAWGLDYPTIVGISLGGLLVPTAIMGTTLPMLTMHFDDAINNVGMSVGQLYFFNTLGAATGAWLSSYVVFVESGLGAAIKIAAAVNLSCFMCTIIASHLLRLGIAGNGTLKRVVR